MVHARSGIDCGAVIRDNPRRGLARTRARHLRLESLEDRHLLNVARIVSGDVYTTPQGVPLDAGLINGQFETGEVAGWRTFTVEGGSLGGIGFPAVVMFDTDDDLLLSNSIQFLPGSGGGGIFQTIGILADSVTISADVAVSAPVANDEAGVFELLFDGEVVASHDFGSIAAGQSEHATLSATLEHLPAGEHEIRFRVARDASSRFGVTPLSFIDNVQVFGNWTGVLGNDTDEDDDLLTSLLVTEPVNGTVELNADGSFRYVPDVAFVGTDSFAYKASDQGQGLTLFTIDAVNDKLLKLDSATGELTVIGAIGHNMLSVDLTYSNGTLYALNAGTDLFELVEIDPDTATATRIVPITINGGAAMTAAKGMTSVNGELFVNFAHRASYCGNACGAAHVLGQLDPDTGVVTGLVNYRSVGGGFNYDFHALFTDASGRIVAERQANGVTTQTFHLSIDPPAITHLGETGNTSTDDAVLAGRSMFVLNRRDETLVRFLPKSVGYGVAVERISLAPLGDELSGLAYAPGRDSSVAEASVVVLGPAAPRVADDSGYSTPEDTTLTVNSASGVLANDAAGLMATLTRAPAHGSVVLNSDGSFVYIPTDDYFGVDRFQYQASDGGNSSRVATVSLLVDPLPDPPVAVDDSFTVDEDAVLNVSADSGVTQNDDDPDGDPLTAILIDDVQQGTLDFSADGAFIYTPPLNYFGTTVFTYALSDGTSQSDPATVSITIQPVNDPPTAHDDEYKIPFGGSLAVGPETGVLLNDEDVDNDDLSAVLATPPGAGQVTLRDDGSFDYVPGLGFTGVDSFTYQAVDGLDISAPAAVTITLDVPVIVVGEHSVGPNSPNQTIEIFVSGGHAVAGLNFFAQIGDGGPELTEFGLAAGTDGPAITSIDLKTGTIFAAIPDEQTNLGGIPQVQSAAISISGPGGSVPARGLLATMTIDTTGFFEGEFDLLLAGILPDLLDGPFNTDFAGVPAIIANGKLVVRPVAVVARHAFYNNSKYDGEDPDAGSADDGAIATDKLPLLPGESASVVNYTNYSRGLNGIMIDIDHPSNAPKQADFEFRIGRGGDPQTWASAPSPSGFLVRPGAGVDGSDRVTVTWDDNVIEKTWLQVTLKASVSTGLLADDVFYFGNAIGETGNDPANALVNATDVIAARDNPHGPLNQAGVDNPFDFNRDRLVNATDVILARDNATSPFNALLLIEAPPLGLAAPGQTYSATAMRRLETMARLAAADRHALRILRDAALTLSPIAARPVPTLHSELGRPRPSPDVFNVLPSSLMQDPQAFSQQSAEPAVYDKIGSGRLPSSRGHEAPSMSREAPRPEIWEQAFQQFMGDGRD